MFKYDLMMILDSGLLFRATLYIRDHARRASTGLPGGVSAKRVIYQHV